MRKITASKARATIYQLIDEVAASRESMIITGRVHNAVLVSAAHWSAVKETLYLLPVPGMHEAVVEGVNAPVDELSTDPGW